MSGYFAAEPMFFNREVVRTNAIGSFQHGFESVGLYIQNILTIEIRLVVCRMAMSG